MFEDIHPTKLSILEAAVEVFGEKGFNGATTKEIAKTAGISEGTIFRHFANKTEVLYEVVNSVVPTIGVETLEKTIEECKGLDARKALRYIIQNRFETVRESRVFMRIIFTEIQYDAELRNLYLNRVFRPICKILKDFILTRIEKGEFRRLDPELLVNVLMSYIFFSVETENLLKEAQNRDFLDQAASTAFTDLLFDGIKGSGNNE